MEGPSLFLAAEQLAPFKGKVIKSVSGNSKIGIERLDKKKILSIFSYGKTLIFQFDTFALRIHFMLFGSFQATVNGVKVTGDYPAKARIPRLAFELANGSIQMYSCSVSFIESADIKSEYDYTIDIMSDEWDSKKALKALNEHSEEEIADVLLDQSIFMGVGNIIKNEVLLLAGVAPTTKVKELSPQKLKKIVDITRDYVFQFYEWRKLFVLRKNYKVYKQKKCKVCASPVIRKQTGTRKRTSYICTVCQKY